MTAAEFDAHTAPIRPLLWHHANRLARGGVPAEDLVQDALLRLWEVRHKAAGHPDPPRWFAQAARWRMLRHLAGERRHRLGGFDPEAMSAAFAARDPEPDEFAALVALAPPRYRADLVRRFAGGATFDQIAAEAGGTGSAACQRVALALGHIRAALAG